MDARTLWLVGIAFFAGLAIPFALFAGGGDLATVGGGAPLLVRVENVGTHDARVSVQVSEVGAESVALTQWDIPAGDDQETRIARRLTGQHSVKVSVTWAEGPLSGEGDVTLVVDPATCRASETMVVSVAVDTTRGVSFPERDRGCE